MNELTDALVMADMALAGDPNISEHSALERLADAVRMTSPSRKALPTRVLDGIEGRLGAQVRAREYQNTEDRS